MSQAYIEPLPLSPEQLPPSYRAAIVEYETELDVIHPGWRSPEREKCRFDHFDYDRKARVKWLLKRRSLLMRGMDWPVVIAPDGRNKRQCYAHAVPPAGGQPREATTSPPSPLAPAVIGSWVGAPAPLPVSLPELAATLRIPLETVEAAMAEAPQGVDAREWCATWHKTRRRAKRAARRAESEVSP
jgi:hypothetical protein